jgi:putative transposase
MAKKWTNENLQGALHFVTGNVRNRRRIFTDDKNCMAFLEELQSLRRDRECKVIAFIVMPDHPHLILNPRDGDIQSCTGILKSLSAKRLIEMAPVGHYANGNENQVRQESFKALPLWSGWMIRQKLNYIHSNPVRAGIAETTADYRWSSFRSMYLGDENPLLQVDKDWWWPEDVEKLTAAMEKKQIELKEEFLSAREAKLGRGQAALPD